METGGELWERIVSVKQPTAGENHERLRRVDSNRKSRSFSKQPSTGDYYKNLGSDTADPSGSTGMAPNEEGSMLLEEHADSPAPSPENGTAGNGPTENGTAENGSAEETVPPLAPPPPPPLPPSNPTPTPPPPPPLPPETPTSQNNAASSTSTHQRSLSSSSGSSKSFNMMSPTGDNSELLAEIKAGKSLKPTPHSKGYTTVYSNSGPTGDNGTTASPPETRASSPPPKPASPPPPPSNHSVISPPATPSPAPCPTSSRPPKTVSTSASSEHPPCNTVVNGNTGSVTAGADSGRKTSLADVEVLVPTHDEQGKAIPEWKRQVMVRKLQAKMQEEEEIKRKTDEEAARLAAMPAWRRDMMKKKMDEEKRDREQKRKAEEEARQAKEMEERTELERIRGLGYDETKLAPWQRQLILKKGDIAKD